MVVIKVNYTSYAPVIKVQYDDTPVYIHTTIDATYIKVDYGTSGGNAVWGDITGTLSDQTDLQTALDAKVPYSGATNDVDLGEHGLSGGYIEFDTTPTGTPVTQGTMYWDDSHSTVALIMNGTIQHIGQDSYYYVKNSSGSSIAKGTAVRFAGTDGASGHLLIAPFLANGTYPSDYFMGVTSETIANGSFGQVTHFGEIEGINTSAYNAGDLLYASTSVAGGYQTTAPVAPNNIILVAAVLNSKNNGIIVVRPTIGSNINKDEGVLFTSKTNKDVIYYDAPSTLFKNASISSILGYTPADSSLVVPNTRTLTINGTSYDLSADRSWTVSGTNIYTADGTLTGNRTVTLSTYTLTLVANSINAPLELRNNNTGGVSAINFFDHNGTNTGAFGYSGTTYSNVNLQNKVYFYMPRDFIITPNGSSSYFKIFNNNGNITINGLTDAGYKLDVQGTGRFTSNLSLTGGSFVAGSLYYSTQYGLVLAGNTGSSSDVLLTDRGGNIRFQIVNGGDIYQTSTYIGNLGINTSSGPRIGNGNTYGLQIWGNTIASNYSIQMYGDNGLNGLSVGNNGNIVIGPYNATNVSSAILQIQSTTKGFLPPQMTSAQRTAISSPAVGLIVYQTDATEGLYEYASTGWRILYNTPSGGSGITRSVNVISTTQTASSAANTDYVYLVSGTTTLTMPTAVGNTNRYTIKNVGTNTITINTTSSQTIDGSTSITIAVRYTTLDLISDGTNWNII